MNTSKPKIKRSHENFGRDRARSRQYGLTLIELMVSLVLGLVIVGGVLNIFFSTNQTSKVNDNLMRIQENARTAFDLMARDIRESGQNSCGAPLISTVIRDGSGSIPWWADWNSGEIIGIAGSNDRTDIVAFGTAENDRVIKNTTLPIPIISDALLILRAEQNEKYVTNHNEPSSTFTLSSTTGFFKGDIVVACDSKQGSIFQLETDSNLEEISNPVSYLPAATALNCSDNLGYQMNQNCTSSPARKSFTEPNATISKILASFWYIGYTIDNKHALYRVRLTNQVINGLTTATTVIDEVVPNVQDLKITYLTRDASTGALATAWVDADAVGIENWGNSNPAATAQVVAVRLDLTLQSSDNVGADQSQIVRHLRHVVSLRNRDTFAAPLAP